MIKLETVTRPPYNQRDFDMQEALNSRIVMLDIKESSIINIQYLNKSEAVIIYKEV